MAGRDPHTGAPRGIAVDLARELGRARAIFWTIPTRFLTGLAAAGGLAFINSIGTLGGFVGPYAVGLLRDATR